MRKESKLSVPVLTAIFFSFLFAQEKEVRNIDIDRLLERTRITITTTGSPNIGTFHQEEPPAIVVDIFDATNKVEPETIKVDLPPVKRVVVSQWKEEPKVVRMAVDLERLSRYQVRREKDLICLEITDEPFEIIPEKKVEERTVTLDVKNADVVDVLRMFAALFDVNFVICPDVKGLITMRLDKVPFSIALDALLKAVECNYVELDENVLLIKLRRKDVEGELVTRFYELSDIEAEDAKKAVDKLISEKGKTEISFRRVGEGGGSRRTSILMVTDLPERLQKIDEAIRELDRPPAQIMIEAKFIETTLSADDIHGVAWSIRAAAVPSVPEVGREIAIPLMFKEMVLGKITYPGMAVALDILRSRGKGKLLATPQTLTLDNQTARINMGVAVPILETRIDPETRERIFIWRERFVPIALSVTPHLTKDGRINMAIETKVEAIIGWKRVHEEEMPIIAIREAKTQISVREGEVIVIGGLIKEQETQAVTKVPILGDIPLLGALFTHKSVKKEKNELIIFIIPRVVPPES